MSAKPLDLSPAIPIFLRRQHAESTRQSYAREIARWMAWAAGNGPLDAEILPRYVESLRARHLSPTTVAWRATVVAGFLTDAFRQGVVERDLVDGYRLPKGTSGFAPRVLSRDELKRLLRTPDRRTWTGKRDLAVLTLLGVAGLRAGEVAGLRVGDVELGSERVVLRVTGKGNRVRVVTLEDQPAGVVRTWARVRADADPGEAFLVAREAGPRGLAVSGVDYIVRKSARAANLAGVHAHLLRHTSATLALRGGASLIDVRDLLGHASVLTTSRYLHAGTGERPTTSYVSMR